MPRPEGAPRNSGVRSKSTTSQACCLKAVAPTIHENGPASFDVSLNSSYHSLAFDSSRYCVSPTLADEVRKCRSELVQPVTELNVAQGIEALAERVAPLK